MLYVCGSHVTNGGSFSRRTIRVRHRSFGWKADLAAEAIVFVEDRQSCLSGLHHIEIGDQLRFAVLEDLEVVARQSAHRIALPVGHGNVDVDDRDFDFLDEGRLSQERRREQCKRSQGAPGA